MFGLFDSTKKAVKKYNKVAHKIMALEDTMKAMSDEALKKSN